MSDSIPVVGIGCTRCVGSDRYPFTIIKVSPKSFFMQEDQFVNGKFKPNLKGDIVRVSLRKDNKWRTSGRLKSRVYVGEREFYHDPSF